MNKETTISIPLRINRENLKKISPDANNTLKIDFTDNGRKLSLISNFFGNSASFDLQGYATLPILKIDKITLEEILKSRKPIFDILSEVVSKAANEVINNSDHPNIKEIAKKAAELLSNTLNEDVVTINKPINYQDGYSPDTNQILIKKKIATEEGKIIQRIENIPLDRFEKAK